MGLTLCDGLESVSFQKLRMSTRKKVFLMKRNTIITEKKLKKKNYNFLIASIIREYHNIIVWSFYYISFVLHSSSCAYNVTVFEFSETRTFFNEQMNNDEYLSSSINQFRKAPSHNADFSVIPILMHLTLIDFCVWLISNLQCK